MASTPIPADICWGTSKKTNRRCANKSKVAEPGCLPTCHQHRDQLLRPGTCQYIVNRKTGERCKRLFHWNPPPPHFQLCPDHVDTPQGPCFFLRLPVELRMEVFKYLLPPGLTVGGPYRDSPPLKRLREFIPLLLTSKQIGAEARDYLYGSTTFHLEVSQVGATFGQRYLYLPRGAEERGDPDRSIVKALDLRQQLNFSSVKNYNLEIIVQNASSVDGWSEEVEMYDLRDSVSAILPYLARAQHLHRLTVRVVFGGFNHWNQAQALANFKLITQPLTTALRNITVPVLEPPWNGDGERRGTSVFKCPSPAGVPDSWSSNLHGPLVPPTDAALVAYQSLFQTLLAGNHPVPPARPPIARMFSAFKQVYLEGAAHMRALMPSGAANYLHRARVARESADPDAFLAARNAFVNQWNAHLHLQYTELARVNVLVLAMFDKDELDFPRTRATQLALQLASPPMEEMPLSGGAGSGGGGMDDAGNFGGPGDGGGGGAAAVGSGASAVHGGGAWLGGYQWGLDPT